MKLAEYFDTRKSIKLVGLNDDFNFIKKLIQNDKLPKVLLLTGKKGIGKATLASHIMYYFFDKKNYDDEKKTLINKSTFYNHYNQNLFHNIIYLNGTNFKNIKIDDIRNLKDQIFKKSIDENKRFIILDDVETFNINSLNALLKIIEEPGKKNYFILINNKSKPLLQTIRSRCLEIKINLSFDNREKIIKHLIKKFDSKNSLDHNLVEISPGNFIKYSFILSNNNINLDDDFLTNFNYILKLFKKEKDFIFKDLLLFFTDYYFQKMRLNNTCEDVKYIEDRIFFSKKINDYFAYNLSDNNLLNSIESKIQNE